MWHREMQGLKSRLNSGRGVSISKSASKSRSFFTSSGIQAACRWHQFRGDTQEYQRAVRAEQLHSQGKEKCKVNNIVSSPHTKQHTPRRRNQISSVQKSDRVAGEGEWQAMRRPTQSFNPHSLIDRDITSGKRLKKDIWTGQVNYGWRRGKKEKAEIYVEKHFRKFLSPSSCVNPVGGVGWHRRIRWPRPLRPGCSHW